jgi:hypothetical protein
LRVWHLQTFIDHLKNYFMKKILFSAALLMGAATISFAGNPKGETKDAKTPIENGQETTTKQKAQALYWYDGSTGVLLDPNPSEEPLSDCNAPSGNCARGFEQPVSDPINTQTDHTRGKI